MRWPVNRCGLKALSVDGWVQAGGHVGSALDQRDSTDYDATLAWVQSLLMDRLRCEFGAE